MANYRTVEYDLNLNEVLANNYATIFDEMKKEDYILEYDSFFEFRELTYDGEIVGFLTLDTFLPDPECLCLNECYILPDFRGKGILIEIIKELLKDENIIFYIRRPNYSFMKFLLKHNMALEVAPDIVTSHIKIVVKGREKYSNKNIKRLYRRLDSQSSEFNFYAAGFHMKLCSVFLSDQFKIIAKKNNILTLTMPRNEDFKKHNCRSKLKKLTLKKMNKIQYDYAINNEMIKEFNEKISKQLNEKNDDILFYEKDGEIIVNKNLKPNDISEMMKCAERERRLGNLTYKSADIRVDYLLEHPHKMNDTVDLSSFTGKEKDIIACPFCGNYCNNGDDICRICGQKVKSLFAKKERFSIRKFLKDHNEFKEKGYVGEVLKDRLLERCERKNYNISEVEQAQMKISNYEIVKYISENRIYFNPPSFSYDYHYLKDYDIDRAYDEGYLRQISDEEYISRIQNEYTKKQLIQEVEVEGMRFSDKEMEKQIYNLKNYTEHWIRTVYEPTEKGIEFINSSRSMEIFSNNLHGFIYYEFEKYYQENKDKTEREICDGFVKKQYGEANEIEIVYYYQNYLWYKYRIYARENKMDEAIVKILQLAIFEVNMHYLKNKRNYLLFVIGDINDLLKSIDEDDVSKYYDIAFDEFKLESFKKRKEEIKKYIIGFLEGKEVYIP